MKLNHCPETDSLYIDLSGHPGVQNQEIPGAPSLSMARQDFPVPLAPFGHGAYSACGFAFGRPRPPCGPADTARPTTA